MASTVELVQYVCEQMTGAGDISYKKMFGEYGIYMDGKFIAALSDNQLFIKITEGGKKLLSEKGAVVEAPPYEGAKPYFRIDDLEDRALLKTLMTVTWKEIPFPKPKKAAKKIK